MPAASTEPLRPVPVLAPGLRVISCGRGQVQIGLDEAVRIRLPDDDTTANLLRLLRAREPDPGNDPALTELLDRLSRAGCVVGSDALRDRRARRAACRVAVTGSLGLDAAPLLGPSGLGSTTDLGCADLVVACGRGEVDRDQVTSLVRRGTPHVLVRVVDDVVTLGPFVVPGQTACLHCITLHQGSEAPVDAVAGTRYARLLQRMREDGQSDPDVVVAGMLGLAWALREVTTWLDGGTPWSWSRVLRLGAEESGSSVRRWLRHPECGCAWWVHQDESATMWV